LLGQVSTMKDVRLCRFRGVGYAGALHEAARRLAGSKEWWLAERGTEICPYIELPETMAALLGRLSRSFRQNLGRDQRRMGEDAAWRMAVLDGDDAASLLPTVRALHRARWTSAAADDAHRRSWDALEKLFRRPGRTVSGKLFALWHDEEVVAARIVLCSGGRAYDYREARTQERHAYGIGHAVGLASCEWAIEHGCREFDLLRGDEPHKARWTSLARRNVDLDLGRRGKATVAARFGPSIRRTLARLKPGRRGRAGETSQWVLTD
jgi:CelD/BcsL family acetyltransferase involved in cellulose biosynthesis